MKSILKDLEPLHKECEPMQNIEKKIQLFNKIHAFYPFIEKENTFSEVAYH